MPVFLRAVFLFILLLLVQFVPSPSSHSLRLSKRLADPELEAYAAGLRPRFVQDLNRFIHATRYTLDLTIDPDARTVKGEEQIRYTNHDELPLDELLLRLYPNTSYMSGGMRLSNVQMNSQPITPTEYLRIGSTNSSVIRIDRI